MSLRDTILATDDIQAEQVEVPEWGVTVEVRGMSGADRAAIMESAMDDGGNVSFTRFYPDIVILTAYDPETGERVFVDGDQDAVMAKNGRAVDRIAEAGLRLSGMTEDARTEAGKDSPSTVSDDSTS